MINVRFYNKQEWSLYASDFHDLVFNNPDFTLIEKIDFACVMFDDEKPIGFFTIRLLDSLSVYIQYGGALEINSHKNIKAYLMAIEEMKTQFINISTLIENVNYPMLKFAMKAGFKINGIRFKDNKIYVEHLLEVKNGEL